VHLVSFEFPNALFVGLASLLIGLVLLDKSLFDAVLEDVVGGIDSPVNSLLNEVPRALLIFDIFKNFEPLTSPLLITFKRLLKKGVIVEEGLLEILYR
jgi:hypothetical protein